jgi:hypothetical protein
MLLGAGVSPVLSGERDFCNAEECAPDQFNVRFGDVANANSIARANIGDIIEISVSIAVESDVQGWNYGLRHDVTKLEILAATAEDLDLPETFFNTTVLASPDNPGAPSPGMVSGMVLAITAEGGLNLPRGQEVVVATARYRVIANLDASDPSLIQFTDALHPQSDAPATRTSVTIGETSRPPSKVVDGEVLAKGNAVDAMPFSRADCNGDGKVNLADAILCANNIFQNKLVFFDCDNMLDANDDGSLDGSDPIRIINWFFVGDVEIPEPFRTCDVDDDDDLACAFSNCLCDDYGLYFGTDPNVSDLDVTGSSLTISMRNSSPVLGFSFGVRVGRTTQNRQTYRLVDSLGLDQDRLVDLAIIDESGVERSPDATNQAEGEVEDIVAVEKASALAGISDDFLAVNLSPGTGPGFTVVYATDLAGATGATIPPSPIDNGGCQVNEIISVRFARIGDCPDWALLFGDDPDARSVDITTPTAPISMRNAGDVLGFSLGVTYVNGDLTFANQTLGKLEGRLVDLVIADAQGIEHVPETNTAADSQAREITDISLGAALDGISDVFFTVDLTPPIGGPGFTVGYSADVSGSGNFLPANGNPNGECDLNEVLILTFHSDTGPDFRRGDCNGDGRLNITDAAICAQNIFFNRLVFFDCDDMLDANDDGNLDTSDPVAILMWVFLNAADLPDPFMNCGQDASDDTLNCAETNCSR